MHGLLHAKDWYAVNDEISETGLRELLNVQWKADGHRDSNAD